ncbi:MAG: biotin/lipoyl-binding protein [Gammaproteobacteria bacterium]|nr:biotin/lipoyl-binding protein [Gammaproteobacteria bacterium]
MIITLALLLSGMSCSQSGTAQEQAGEAVRTVNVQVQEIVPRDFSSYLRLVGNVEAASDVRLSAEASGRIITYYVSKGDEVGEGDLLAKIDDARLQREREGAYRAGQRSIRTPKTYLGRRQCRIGD